MSKKPVIVYGASGYTGRLVCEFLRHYGIPFIAAGRDKKRVADGVALVPGIESADYEVVQVDHTVDALAELFDGAEVVCNTVGPFALYGDVVIEACLKAGCHYLDTTGEQEWMLAVKNQFSDAYAEAGKVLIPSMAYMHGLQDIAAYFCMETEGIDTFEGTCSVAGVPTFGSTQTVFQLVRAKQLYLENNEYVPWPPAKGYDIIGATPGISPLGHPWGGSPVILWLKDEVRARSAKVVTSFMERSLMEQVIELGQYFEAELRDKSEEEQIAALGAMAADRQPGMPPRENPLIHRHTDTMVGRGTHKEVICTFRGFGAYQQTGALQAAAAYSLLNQAPNTVGFCSPSQAIGHRYLKGQLENFGFIRMELTHHG